MTCIGVFGLVLKSASIVDLLLESRISRVRCNPPSQWNAGIVEGRVVSSSNWLYAAEMDEAERRSECSAGSMYLLS